MEAKGSPASSAVIAEVSFSLQDELTATIQNALGVAVEIAVVEITKLLDKTLRDVQDKIQAALVDNRAVSFRLRTAETQLSTMCNRLEQQQQQPQGVEGLHTGSRTHPTKKWGHQHLNPLNVIHSSPTQETEPRADPEHNYEVCGSEDGDGRLFQRESACEILRGSACSQTLLDTLQESQHRLFDTNDLQNDQPSLTKHASQFDQACSETAVVHGIPGVMNEVYSSIEVAVKVEKDDSDSIPVSLSGGEEPNSDSLSLAQARLLEDWKPEPFQSESCQSNLQSQSTSLSLDLDLLPTPESGHHAPFPKVYNNYHKSPKRRPFPPGRSAYHCSLCGRDFNRKHHLKIHQRIHTGERPYACSVCSARFRHALTLTRHFRLHTGEKPYACGQCGKTFRNGSGLRYHQCSITTTV